jgi:hypothetical protein
MDRIDKIARIPKAWYFVAIVASTSLLIFDVLDHRVLYANWDLESYQQAPTCLNSNLCKQILQATVSENKTKLIFRSAQSYVPKGPNIPLPTLAENYTVYVVLPDKSIQSAIIIPNVPVSTKYFSFKDVSTPTSGDPYFAERNFPAGKEVKVEIWQGQITFIFTASNIAEDIILNRDPKEIGIPTANHPGVILSLAQRNFDNGVYVELLVLVLTIAIALRMSKFSFSQRKHANPH